MHACATAGSVQCADTLRRPCQSLHRQHLCRSNARARVRRAESMCRSGQIMRRWQMCDGQYPGMLRPKALRRPCQSLHQQHLCRPDARTRMWRAESMCRSLAVMCRRQMRHYGCRRMQQPETVCRLLKDVHLWRMQGAFFLPVKR